MLHIQIRIKGYCRRSQQYPRRGKFECITFKYVLTQYRRLTCDMHVEVSLYEQETEKNAGPHHCINNNVDCLKFFACQRAAPDGADGGHSH